MDELFEQAPCGFFSFFDDGALLKVNGTTGRLLQYDVDQLTGKNVETIFSLASRIFFQTHFFPLVKMHGHAEEIFLTLLTKDKQQLPVLLNAQRTTWDEKVITSCAFIVVPNRKKFEDELVAARNEAEKALHENTALLAAKADLQLHAEKLEAQMVLVKKQNHELQQFNHVVTHSLREPLRKILLFATKLQETTDSPTLQKLVKSSTQLEMIIAGLQQYIWLDPKTTRFSSVDLNTLVEKATAQLRMETGTDVLSLNYGHLECVDGDAGQLQLLFYHLFQNAVKFRKNEKAAVTINTVAVKKNKFRSVEDKYQYEEFIKLEVEDKGIGLNNIYRDHIFELFRKLNSGEGQGLGLALCRKIVANHYGDIEADGEENVFTRITVWLPKTQPGMEVHLPSVAK